MTYRTKIFFLCILSLNLLSDNKSLPMTEDKHDAYNGIVTCDELVEKIFQRKWDLRSRPSLFKDGVVPKCSNDQFPEKWIESKQEIDSFGYTICDKPPCTIFQFPLMGNAAGNNVGRIYGRNKIFLDSKIKTIEGVGSYETSSPWYREWYSFTFEKQTYYIPAVSIDING